MPLRNSVHATRRLRFISGLLTHTRPEGLSTARAPTESEVMEANAILDGTVVLGRHAHGTNSTGQGAVPGEAVGVLGGRSAVRMEPLPRPDTTGARASMSAPPPPLRVSHGIDQRRHKGEDRTAQLQSGAISLYLVADGHGGSGAARLAAERLLRDISTTMAAGAVGAVGAAGAGAEEPCSLRQVMLVQAMRAAFARLHAAAQQAERGIASCICIRTCICVCTCCVHVCTC